MHGFRSLGDVLRKSSHRGEELKQILLSHFERELAALATEEIVLVDAARQEVGRARTVAELAELLRRVDVATLRHYSASDAYSVWLMR